MSVQSDAAKAYLYSLFDATYKSDTRTAGTADDTNWYAEYQFAKLDTGRKWRFDFCVPMLKVAIELDGGTFKPGKTGHASGTGLRSWREKNNAAMAAGWRVWHYAPEEVIKAGRKTLPDEPILLCLPWLEKKTIQEKII